MFTVRFVAWYYQFTSQSKVSKNSVKYRSTTMHSVVEYQAEDLQKLSVT